MEEANSNTSTKSIWQEPLALLRRALHWSTSPTRGLREPAIVEGIAAFAPDEVSELLDIGSGDGRIAARVSEILGATAAGVDVQLQPETRILVQEYDGRNLPFESGQFDLVTIVDVLHHADDPDAVITDALRVLRPHGRLIIKDHVRKGRWSNWVLAKMDFAGNYGTLNDHTGRYFSMDEWESLVAKCGGSISLLKTPFRVHGLPWRIVARDSYHLVFAVTRSGSN